MYVTPKPKRIAGVVAIALAALVAASAVTTGPLPGAVFALAPLCAGIGILRRRVWSAYGLAVYILGQLFLMPFALVRQGRWTAQTAQLLASAGVCLLLSVYFIRTGRALQAAGGRRGYAFPWVLATALTTLPLIFVQAFVNPTGSMENTLLAGDSFLVGTFPRTNPALGEMIVFHYPVDRAQTFTKRIVGMPGDRIKIADKILYRNGVRVEEPWAVHKVDWPDSYRDNFPSEPNTRLFPPAYAMLAKDVVNGEVVVPPGKYFVLGDNRDRSLDSRYWGFVSDADIVGKPLLIYDSRYENKRERWNRLFRRL